MAVEDTPEHRDLYGAEGECVVYYQDLPALVEKVQALCREPVRARHVGTMDRTLKWVRRRPILAGLYATIAALVVLAAGSVIAHQRQQIQRAHIAGHAPQGAQHLALGLVVALARDQAAGAAHVLGEGAVRLAMRAPGLDATGERAIVYLPEGMRPTVLSIDGVGGTVEPAPPQHRWVAYGDSIAEGWVASGPSGAWPAIAGRTHRLDVCNMGYAGSARGEIVSAEHVATLDADVISITHGTNCWTRIPFSVEMMRAGTAAFIDVVRQGHPETPIVVSSPVVRPDAEATPNRLGATLADLRAVMEEVAQARVDAGDKRLTLVPGGDIIGPELLADGIHPGDEGHRVLAEVIGGAVRDALDRS